MSVDNGQTFPHVTFDDFEEQNGGMIYHPEMEKSEDELSIPVFPELGSMVLLWSINYLTPTTHTH